MEVMLRRIDVASSQVNTAIRHIVNDNAYIPAITLAAAAEEILSKNLGEKSIHAKLKKQLVPALGLSEREVSDNHLNKTKTLFKHWPIKDETVSVDIETEAIQYVVRALANMVNFNQTLPSEAPRFMKWLKENRPELYEELADSWEKTAVRLDVEIPPSR